MGSGLNSYHLEYIIIKYKEGVIIIDKLNVNKLNVTESHRKAFKYSIKLGILQQLHKDKDIDDISYRNMLSKIREN
jgi:hypothetical protein